MMDGFVNVLKPPGMTSHDVVGQLRRILGTKKVGHAGTLDPAASGVLPVAVGRATRLIEYLDEVDKSYRAELTFGYATDSGDDLGNVTARATSFTMPEDAALARAVASFTGTITQVPPVYSAIKIGGRRACDLARQGVAVDIPTREVTIYRLEVLARDVEKKQLLLDVDCSKGTYIRSLCRDLGDALGVPAVMSFLVRTRVGGFTLAASHTLEESAALGERVVEQVTPYLSHLTRYDLAPSRARSFANGLPTHDEMLAGMSAETRLAVYSDDVFLGIARYDTATASVIPSKIYALNG